MSHGFIARFVVQPGRRDDALAVLDNMIDHVGSEPGTLVYLVHTDRDDPDVIWCYERYVDEDGVPQYHTLEQVRSDLNIGAEFVFYLNKNIRVDVPIGLFDLDEAASERDPS